MENVTEDRHIKGFVEDKAIPLRSKIITIAIMWLSTIITSLLLVGFRPENEALRWN
jgi:uncharacterized membrane protein YbaN (DUF454 family)